MSNLTEKICKKCNTIYKVLSEYTEKDNGLCISCMEKSEKNSPTEVIIKHAELDVQNSNIRNKKLPKPQNLNEYIGQKNNKQSILAALKIIKEVFPINIFLFGYPGCGKTTLAEIVATELQANFIYSIPEQLKNMDKITEILNQIQTNENLIVWMIDEIHNIDKKLVNILLPVLQDRKLGNVKIREFVLIGATTDYNKLHKKSEALISRFQTRIFLERYTQEELVLILKQYLKKLNYNIEIPEKDYHLIAQNSKGIPREAINLLLKRLVIHNVTQIFKESKIVKNGLNKKDIQILQTLDQIKSPIGSNFLSQRVGLLEEDYKQVYEPFLIEQNYVERTSKGRLITNKGKEFLSCL